MRMCTLRVKLRQGDARARACGQALTTFQRVVVARARPTLMFCHQRDGRQAAGVWLPTQLDHNTKAVLETALRQLYGEKIRLRSINNKNPVSFRFYKPLY